MRKSLPEQQCDMLLFSLELENCPYKYRLYFVRQTTLETEQPVICCFWCGRRDFIAASLGGVYSLECSGAHITAMRKDAQRDISDTDYFYLCGLRDSEYRDEAVARYIGLDTNDYSPRDYYYDFRTSRELLEFDPPPMKRALVFATRLCAYLLSMIIPVGLYLLFIYAATFWMGAPTHSVLGAVSVPLAALLSLPFIIWMMLALFALCEALLLNFEYSRYSLLRLYFLRWAGMRRSCFVEPPVRRAMRKYGLITGALMLAGVLLAFVIF